MKVDLLIIGAGVTGIGAALRIEQLKAEGALGRDVSWLIVDPADVPGGNAISIHHEGAIFDVGNHVIHSHYDYFDELLDELIPADQWIEQVPSGWVAYQGRLIPQPFQMNFRHLPEDEVALCIAGLFERTPTPDDTPDDYLSYLYANFGRGLTDIFFAPLDAKRWSVPLTNVAVEWAQQRSGSRRLNVPLVDPNTILDNIARGVDTPAWTAADTFRYPAQGGNGAVTEALVRRVPSDHLRMGRAVVHIDAAARRVELDDGTTIEYETLLSTMPLDLLTGLIADADELARTASSLVYASTLLVGFVVDGPMPEPVAGKHWIYFPEPSAPFYRVTLPSNFSPANAVPGTWTLLCEINTPPTQPRQDDDTIERSWASLIEQKIVPHGAVRRSAWHRAVGHGYPVPFAGRDSTLDAIHRQLEPLGIVSRGRFGGWKYEVSNQDHALAQGREAVDALYLGTPETTYPSGNSPAREPMK